MKKIVIFDKVEQKYISIDQSSGGYPYYVDSVEKAYFFLDVDKALDYRKTFIGSYSRPSFNADQWRVQEVEIFVNILKIY